MAKMSEEVKAKLRQINAKKKEEKPTLRKLKEVDLLAGCDRLEEIGPAKTIIAHWLNVDSPGACMYLKYAATGQDELLATRLWHRKTWAVAAKSRRIDTVLPGHVVYQAPDPDRTSRLFWYMLRPIIVFRSGDIRQVLELALPGQLKEQYLGNHLYSDSHWIEDKIIDIGAIGLNLALGTNIRLNNLENWNAARAYTVKKLSGQ